MHASPDLRSSPNSQFLQWHMTPNQCPLCEVRASALARPAGEIADIGANGRAIYTLVRRHGSLRELVQQRSVKWLEMVWMAGITTRLAASTESTATRASAAFARLMASISPRAGART